MRRLLVCSLLSIAASRGVAHADEEVRDPDVAIGLVAAGELAAAGLVAAGVLSEEYPDDGLNALTCTGLGLGVVAPSLGHVYAGEYGHALVTTALRGGALYGLYYAETRTENGSLLAIGSAMVLTGLIAYDVVDARRAADRRNAREEVRIVPAALGGDRGTAWGLAASGTF